MPRTSIGLGTRLVFSLQHLLVADVSRKRPLGPTVEPDRPRPWTHQPREANRRDSEQKERKTGANESSEPVRTKQVVLADIGSGRVLVLPSDRT